MIAANAAECVRCHALVYSRNRHDYREHSCHPSVWFAVDGGYDYVKRLWGVEWWPGTRPEEHYIERSVFVNPRAYDNCLRGLQDYVGLADEVLG